MQSILILDSSESFRDEIGKELQKDFQIFSCATPEEAFALLETHRPDGLIVNMLLCGMDGLTFLERIPGPLPRGILVRAPNFSDYTLQRLEDLGVGFPVLSICSIRIAAHRMRDIMKRIETKKAASLQDAISYHLERLQLPHLSGHDDVRLGIPVFMQDLNQSMTKEFYPAVAALRGRPNWQQSEEAIRKVKEKAYDNRNEVIWQEYFGDIDGCPQNRQFMAGLVKCIAPKSTVEAP